MKKYFIGAATSLVLASFSGLATTHYVDLNSSAPTPPYTNWLTAATNIQDAILAASFADTILVTNGIYQYGGDSFSGSNRVDTTVSVHLQSVNGPVMTVIKGYQVPGTTNGASAVRCVYLREFSTLSGFTLANGAAQNGGGLVMESQCVVSNCVIAGNASAGNGGGVYSVNNPLVTNCVISGNVAIAGTGGGAYGCVMMNCVLSNNIASNGGGVGNCTVYNSLLTANGNTNSVSGTSGGATYLGALNNCTIVGNFSRGLGACDSSAMNNCIIYYNINGSYADCYQCRLTNCCTSSLVNNGIPLNTITNAPGFVNAPLGDFHLLPWSRCVDTGNNAAGTNNFDLDGSTRIVNGTVDMGCYETQSSLLTNIHYVSLLSTNPVAPYTNWLTAATNIPDAVNLAQPGEWIIADDGIYTNGGTVVVSLETNRVVLTNSVILASAGGAQSAMIVGGTQTRCVYVGSNSILIGFTLTNGNAAASGSVTNDQSGGGAWCETGGVISNCWFTGNSTRTAGGLGAGVFGGTIYSCIISNGASVNNGLGCGAAFADLYNCQVVSNGTFWPAGHGGGLYAGVASNCIIRGNIGYFDTGGAYRSALYNCTISQNSSSLGVGGVFQSFLTNCFVSGNYGHNGGASLSTNCNCIFTGNFGNDGGGMNGGISYNCIFSNNVSGNGGGALNGTLYNCLLVGNSAGSGGGVQNATLYNCTVVGNNATNSGGGVNSSGGSVNNSIVYYNTAPNGSNYSGAKFNFSCSAPATSGVSASGPPLFADTNGNFHLMSNSPCINAGNNSFAPGTTDFDNNPRIAGGTVDIGAYEFQLPSSILSYAWAQQFGISTDGSADYADSDGDGLNNWQEWRAGTDPTNSVSVLQLLSPSNSVSGLTVTWQSVSGVTYYLDRSIDLGAQPAFSNVSSNIHGLAGTTSYTDTNAVGDGSFFYRVGVQ